mmetsp:Transcript_16251/g.30737  ORF Transcript_16251/g.30737 Transcript_16251/m.30737 type:complete len:449 (-) Transcript_16251:692-2038(-)
MEGHNNCCTLLGIVPPEKELFDLIRNQCHVNRNVSWSDEYVIVPDQENEGEPTLVMSAIMRTVQHNSINHGQEEEQEDILLVDPSLVHMTQDQDRIVETPQDLINSVAEFLKKTTKIKDTPSPRVELWASAPAPLPLWNANVNGSIVNRENNENLILLDPSLWSKEKAHLTLRKWGIVVQKQVLNLTEVKKIRSIVDEAIQEVELSLSVLRPDIQVGKDTIIFKEIASRNLERFDLRLTSDVALNFVHDHVLQKDIVQGVLTQCLGDLCDIDFDISVVYSKPGANTQGWHADGAHPSAFNDSGWDRDGWKTRLADAYAICLFIPLIDLNYEVGFTQFWPGSHRSRDLVGFGPVAELTCSVFDAIGSAGDGIWYDYRLLHRGMPNISSRTIRPVIQILFKKKWYVERANYGKQSILIQNNQPSDDHNSMDMIIANSNSNNNTISTTLSR